MHIGTKCKCIEKENIAIGDDKRQPIHIKLNLRWKLAKQIRL